MGGSYVQVTSLGPVAVKGLHVPVEVYEVLGAGPVRTGVGWTRRSCARSSRWTAPWGQSSPRF
jgi:hypothetical protein